MRADRLVQALLLLQGRPRVTAAELAEELEVSVATARRDLEALSMAGIPVYPQPGRHGGWSLIGGARTDLTGLTAHEAQALFTLAGPAAAVSEEAKAAVRKLVQALPAPFRADALAAGAATTIDATRWGARPAPFLDLLRGAVVERRVVRLDYRSRAGREARWVVEPLGIVDKGGVHYLLAGTEHGMRSFRLDRVAAAEVTDERFSRPEGFDLEQAWQEVAEWVEALRSTVSAVVLVPQEHADVLVGQFGRQAVVEDPAPDGRARIRLMASTPLDVARWLAGWGAGAEVVEGDAVRAELARLGAELVERYGVPTMQ